MKTIEIKYFLLAILVITAAMCNAQTVNTGELTIMPGAIMSSVVEMDNTVEGDLINDGDLYLYGHYNNDGLTGFTHGLSSGTTHMSGSKGYQDISGSVIVEWYNVEFNNSDAHNAFHLSNELRIKGKADFKNGVLDADSYGGLVVFENQADHINAGDQSYVQGEVRKNGNQAFRFPVGSDGKYRNIGMSTPENTLDAFTAKYVHENSNTMYSHSNKTSGIDRIDESEYWILDKMSGKSSVFLTLGWNEDVTDSEIYKTPYDEIHIVRWDTKENMWIDEGGVVNADAKEVAMVVKPVQDYGVFALARVKDEGFLPCGGKGIQVFNAVSANDDGHNDYFNIQGIENCSANTVEIYNRWGVKVYETSAYNTSGNVFKGISEGKMTVNKGEKLPEGTYFYVIDIQGDSKGKPMKKAGYLYLNY